MQTVGRQEGGGLGWALIWCVVIGSWALALTIPALSHGGALSHDAALGTTAVPGIGSLLLFLVAWQVMTAAMMLPSSLPMVGLFARASRGQARPGFALAAFLAAYFAVWTGFALLALTGDAALHRLVERWGWLEARPWLVTGSVLVLAGAFQFSPLKERCLDACRTPLNFLWRYYRRGTAAAWALGLRHGLFCLGCCWALMLTMFAVPGRTGAATFVAPELVITVPSVKRSTRDLIRLDPRSDGNFSFGGRNWLYNNISLDGSYFNNPYGLDDPAPGGQANAEPVPFDAVEQVQVSIAPFDVRQGGFTGANINTVTKSGTNTYRGAIYSFVRNDELQGEKVRGSPVIANPDLKFLQSGISIGGPLIRNKLFFYLNAEIERTEDPGTQFVASRGPTGFGISRVRASTMDSIRARLQTYNYDTGPYEGYIHETNNDKLLLKLDWNASEAHTASLRFNYLDATRDLPPHPFVLSFANTGRGPNESSLPFRNSGYAINNRLDSYAFEVNSRSSSMANRFFASYNRFRDARAPFSADFPTVEIAEGGVTYTTAGHEPFSIHNILDQDVWQLTDNLSFFRGNHVFTLGGNFELFGFFNSFNIFRHGVFFLPPPTTSRLDVRVVERVLHADRSVQPKPIQPQSR